MARKRAAQNLAKLLGELVREEGIAAEGAFAPDRIADTARIFLDTVLFAMFIRRLMGEDVKSLRKELPGIGPRARANGVRASAADCWPRHSSTARSRAVVRRLASVGSEEGPPMIDTAGSETGMPRSIKKRNGFVSKNETWLVRVQDGAGITSAFGVHETAIEQAGIKGCPGMGLARLDPTQGTSSATLHC
jgi:hypothetical protein